MIIKTSLLCIRTVMCPSASHGFADHVASSGGRSSAHERPHQPRSSMWGRVPIEKVKSMTTFSITNLIKNDLTQFRLESNFVYDPTHPKSVAHFKSGLKSKNQFTTFIKVESNSYMHLV